ncbi:MAG: hypothetical protein VX133_12005 [Pseudomonadota bacterium]|nr:hypothetical protein [Pseudomonadota bacterium]
MIYHYTYESRVPVSPQVAWEWITSVDGISKEMSPLLRMTAPKGVKKITDVEVTLGRPLFKSCLLLFGVIPVDYSHVTLVKFDDGQSFTESSKMGSMKLWKHRREVIESESGCLIRDILEFEPVFASSAVAWCVNFLFKHRGRRLRRFIQ